MLISVSVYYTPKRLRAETQSRHGETGYHKTMQNNTQYNGPNFHTQLNNKNAMLSIKTLNTCIKCNYDE